MFKRLLYTLLFIACAAVPALSAGNTSQLYGIRTQYYQKANKIFKAYAYGVMNDNPNAASTYEKQFAQLYNEVYAKLKATKSSSELANITSKMSALPNEKSDRCYFLIAFLGNSSAKRSEYMSKMINIVNMREKFYAALEADFDSTLPMNPDKSASNMVNNTYASLKQSLSSDDFAKLKASQQTWKTEADRYYKKLCAIDAESDFELSPYFEWNMDRAYYLIYLIN